MVEHIRQLDQLRGKPDEAVFNYAIQNKAVIITRDLDFANILRFKLKNSDGIIIIRFPNEVSITTLASEIERLTENFLDEDYRRLNIIEPGSVRSRDF